LDKNYFLEEFDYLNGKLPDISSYRPELVLRSSCYPKSKITQCWQHNTTAQNNTSIAWAMRLTWHEITH